MHPAAAGMPVVEMFCTTSESSGEDLVPPRWDVRTESSRYLLDLHEGTVSRHALPVDDPGSGSVRSQLRRDGEVFILLAVLDCRVGRPMLLMLCLDPDGRIGTVRVTTNVRSCRPADA
jgi:hypothetical protein